MPVTIVALLCSLAVPAPHVPVQSQSAPEASPLNPVIERTPPPRVPLTPRAKGLAAGVVLGTAVLAAGVILLAIGIDDAVPNGTDTANALGSGPVLIVIGVATVATTGALLTRERRKMRARGQKVRWEPVAAGLTFRF